MALLGFDLGGTKMLGLALGETGEILLRKRRKVVEGRDNDAVTAAVGDLLEKIAAESPEPVTGIGIAVPGPIDFAEGTILETPNLGLKQLPLRRILEERFNLPVMLENDVNAGVYGEYRDGAAKGYSHVVGLFPGTGFGGGLILNGRLYRGATGGAGEIGHMTIDVGGRRCNCGNFGCLEALAARSSVAKDLAGAALAGDAPTVYEEAGSDIGAIRSGTILRALENGDRAAGPLIHQMAFYLGVGMANCVNIFDPEIIVVGGGVVEKLGKLLLDPAEQTMRERALPRLVDHVRVAVAALGDDATALGAAYLAREEFA
ncbi:MAG: ROK family protein [Spirochaetaceae bacterium]